MMCGRYGHVLVAASLLLAACGPEEGARNSQDDQPWSSDALELVQAAQAEAAATMTAGTAGTAHGPGWPLAGFDAAATGYNPFEQRLRRSNIDQLVVQWVFDTAAAGMPVRPMHSTPVVDDRGNVYAADFAGTFFAISHQGKLRWSFSSDPPTPQVAALLPPEIGPSRASPFLGGAALASRRPYVVVGDANGRVYARHRDSGREVWTARDLDDNPLGGVAGNSLSIVGDTVLVGLGSLENYALVLTAAGLRVDCCAHRGALVALDLETGRKLWRHDTIADPVQPLPAALLPFTLGPAGADIWSQPTYDADTGTIFFSTGQNLSPQADGHSTPTSDAIIAVDARTGIRKWVHQFTVDDIWAVGVENPNPVTGRPVDMDLGDAPKIYRLRNGRKVVGAGQKDGRYHVLDAATGKLVRTTEVISPRNDLGGFQTGGAFAYDTVFQHGMGATAGFTDCNEGACPYQGFDGRVVALSPDGAQVRWSLAIPVSPLVGGLAVANHMLFFQSPVEESVPMQDSPRWGLYAVDVHTGAVLRRMTFPGRAVGSPVVAGGHVYVTNGNVALGAYGVVPDGSLMRLGLGNDECGDSDAQGAGSGN
jgi:polyvinyl alcohol dehydrogenase (cytochrome)